MVLTWDVRATAHAGTWAGTAREAPVGASVRVRPSPAWTAPMRAQASIAAGSSQTMGMYMATLSPRRTPRALR